MFALPFIIIVDLAMLNVALLLFDNFGWQIATPRGWFAINLIYVICVLCVRPVSHQRFSRVEKVASKSFGASALFFVFIAIHIWIDKSFDVNDLHFCIVAVVTSFLLFWSRIASRGIIKAVRRLVRQRRVVYVGAGRNLAYLHRIFSQFLSSGYVLLGYFNDRKSTHLPEDANYLGSIPEVIPWLEKNKPQYLYCNLPVNRQQEITEIMTYCEKNFIHFRAVTNVRNYVNRAMSVEMVDDMPVLKLHNEPLSSIENRIVKRTFDIIVSGLFLVTCFWWIYIIVAIITKITMPGPVFFRQKRNGIMGEEFYCLKFRSMKVNADADKVQATKDDPRKTKWGNIMRKTNIDELPQFVNVFLGDMSIVGPRPHMVKHTEEYSALIDSYMVRHWVKPGITGWAQVTGARGETSELWQMEERIEKDIWYIERWSIWLDIRIIFKTVYNVFGGEKGNAY